MAASVTTGPIGHVAASAKAEPSPVHPADNIAGPHIVPPEPAGLSAPAASTPALTAALPLATPVQIAVQVQSQRTEQREAGAVRRSADGSQQTPGPKTAPAFPAAGTAPAAGMVATGQPGLEASALNTATPRLEALSAGAGPSEFAVASSGHSGAAPATGAAPPPGSPHAASVAAQIGQALLNSAKETTLVQLQPEELGKVALTLRGDERGMTVHIAAERSETLDLMRRNVDELSAELQDMGYESLSFEFGGDPGGADDPAPSAPDTAAAEPLLIADDDPDSHIAQNRPRPARGELDIRL